MTKILETKDARFSYADGHEALRGISISLEEGSKVALVGPNGAGKSTLMLMFNAILRPTSGYVTFKGQHLKYDSKSLRELRRRVGMVFQNPDDQIFAPTVYQDVAFGPTNLGYSKEKVEKYVCYALSYVGLDGYERRPPHHLSGGEKKRVAIAGVLAMEPEVMILDEPTSAVDPASSEEIMDMLDELNFYGKTLVISTHDVELAYRWADEVVLMAGGTVLRQGPPEDVFSNGVPLKKSRLKPPMILDLYMEMAGRGMVNGDEAHPRNILDLMNLMEEKMGRSPTARPGLIYICDVDEVDRRVLTDFCRGQEVGYVGSMGTRAKLLAEELDVELDFSYGVIDRCLLKALIGHSCLIMTSGGMVDHAIKRIRDYGEESGMKIEVRHLAERVNPDRKLMLRGRGNF